MGRKEWSRHSWVELTRVAIHTDISSKSLTWHNRRIDHPKEKLNFNRSVLSWTIHMRLSYFSCHSLCSCNIFAYFHQLIIKIASFTRSSHYHMGRYSIIHRVGMYWAFYLQSGRKNVEFVVAGSLSRYRASLKCDGSIEGFLGVCHPNIAFLYNLEVANGVQKKRDCVRDIWCRFLVRWCSSIQCFQCWFSIEFASPAYCAWFISFSLGQTLITPTGLLE